MSEVTRFNELKSRLPLIWSELQTDPTYEHTSVIVPSLSVNQEELSKVVGASYYEERLLFALIRLRNPNASVIYVTSQPVHPDVVDYYLDLLENIPARHALQRLHMLSAHDASARPLTEKVLERPRLMARIRRLIRDPNRAYLTCYNSTPLERTLAVQLGLPLNGLDPELLHHGTKSGNRKIFRAAGVPYPAGHEDLHTEDEVVAALMKLGTDRPDAKRAVVKLNEGFGGEGNGLYTFPSDRGDENATRDALQNVAWTAASETHGSFLRKLAGMGGIVEEFMEAEQVRSPSVQIRVHPDGQAALVSSHEQVLGGATGQSYLGCRFPAHDDYRVELQGAAAKIGQVLSAGGVIGRAAIDFLVCRDEGEAWKYFAIEINLRMSGTTPPYHALEFLSGGRLNPSTGLFTTAAGVPKFYSATDNLKSPQYRGLVPEDLFEIIARRGMGFSHATGTGVLFYMIGALSQYGKIGMTCIGDSAKEAQALFEHTVAALDEETGGSGHGVQGPLLDRLAME